MPRVRPSVHTFHIEDKEKQKRWEQWMQQHYWTEDTFLSQSSSFDGKSSNEHCLVQNIIEIGFGKGEHVLNLLSQHQQTNILAIDPFLQGFYSLYQQVTSNNFSNKLWVYHGLFHQVPFQYRAQCDAIYALFLDPWPKSRHAKKRLFQPFVIDIMVKILHAFGKIFVAHDDPDFLSWTVHQFQYSNKFSVVPWDTSALHTRYANKAQKYGRSIQGYIFQKIN